MKRLAIPLAILLALSIILTACTSSPAQAPFVYGVWADYDASLSGVMRVNQDGQNPTTLAEDSNGIFLFQLVTYHNYAAPLSPDGQYLALYLKDTAGLELNIHSRHFQCTHPFIFDNSRSYSGYGGIFSQAVSMPTPSLIATNISLSSR